MDLPDVLSDALNTLACCLHVSGQPWHRELERALHAAPARAIARGVYEATALPFPAAQPAWRDRFGTPAGA